MAKLLVSLNQASSILVVLIISTYPLTLTFKF